LIGHVRETLQMRPCSSRLYGTITSRFPLEGMVFMVTHDIWQRWARLDARARSTFLLQVLVPAAMGAFIPQAGGTRGAAFAIAAAVLFTVLAVLWLLAARGDRPEYRRSSRLFVAGTAACAVLLARTCVAVAAGCLAVGAARPAPVVLGLALVLLLSIPWGFAITHRLASEAGSRTP
jgi:hypothetical protein